MMAKTKVSAAEGPSVRDRILSEAMHLAAARGFEATSIQAIADAVGIRKQSLLYHFSSKELLHEKLIEELVSGWNEVLPGVMLAASNGRGRFEAVIRAVVEFFAAEPERARLLLREVLDRPEEMRRVLNHHSQVWSAVIRDYIKEGQELGSVDPALDPETYILHIATLVVSGLATFGTMSAFLRSEHGGEERTELERYVDEMMRIAQRSLFLPRPKKQIDVDAVQRPSL